MSEVAAWTMDDSASVLDPSVYQVDAASAPARLALKPAAVLPANLRAINAVSIAFTAGYGDGESDVPAPVREAILEIVAGLYANRGDAPADLPLAAFALLAPYRVLKL